VRGQENKNTAVVGTGIDGMLGGSLALRGQAKSFVSEETQGFIPSFSGPFFHWVRLLLALELFLKRTTQVREPETISFHDFADASGDFPLELRAPVAKGMKLTSLTAGIDARRQFGQQLFIVFPAHKPVVQLLRVHAG
jgi:hypothetical protein